MLLPYLNKELIEAGCDEAGRGCLAGAVYAAAVILPKDFKNELLNDSKQLKHPERLFSRHASCCRPVAVASAASAHRRKPL